MSADTESKESRRLLHTMLRVADLDQTIQFYTDMLGMKLLRKKDFPEGKFSLAFVGYEDEESGTVIELTYNWDRLEGYELGTAFGHLAIGVPDVYAVCDKLQRAGVPILRPAGPMAGGDVVMAFVADPDGYRIELLQE